MDNRFMFYTYRVSDIFQRFILKRQVSYKNLSDTLGTHKMLSPEDANEMISEGISKGSFFAGRYGGFELWTVLKCLEGKMSIDSDLIYTLQNNAGFFGVTDESLHKFTQLYLEGSRCLDLIGRHWNGMENYLIRTYATDSEITNMFFLEPWYPGVINPWTKALKGKKVVVVHPFEATIIHQYDNRKRLFTDEEFLPDFSLRIVKAVQTIAGEKDPRFDTWFDALQYMYDECMKEEFDVAIIGCGAYGFPLAARIKQSGKVAIHMGGATQLLFGIKGKRWVTHPDFKYVADIFNENWIYPLDEDRVQNSSRVEAGCYWDK